MLGVEVKSGQKKKFCSKVQTPEKVQSQSVCTPCSGDDPLDGPDQGAAQQPEGAGEEHGLRAAAGAGLLDQALHQAGGRQRAAAEA